MNRRMMQYFADCHLVRECEDWHRKFNSSRYVGFAESSQKGAQASLLRCPVTGDRFQRGKLFRFQRSATLRSAAAVQTAAFCAHHMDQGVADRAVAAGDGADKFLLCQSRQRLEKPRVCPVAVVVEGFQIFDVHVAPRMRTLPNRRSSFKTAHYHGAE